MSFIAHKFSLDTDAEFNKTLRKRVNEYFRTNNISRHANVQMVIKTIFMISLLFVPYSFLLSGVIENSWAVYGMWILMAFGMSGIGLSIMHDANHNSYSKRKGVNIALSYLLNFVGGNVPNWKIQHNVLHHPFTNIDGADEDLDGPIFLRFSPHQKALPMHKFQHIYAWFFYCLMTLSWATTKEFVQLARYRKNGLITTQKKYNSILAGLVFWKLFYFGYALVLPMILIPVSPMFTVLCFLTMHAISGLILSVIFQSAHIVDNSEFPVPDINGDLKNNWAVHQILNTTNFAPKNKILSWYVGGLNYQVEHHLFPEICHIHYKNIAKIVKSTTQEFGLPYYSIPTFMGALTAHAQMLRKLGTA
jgi:linoleoyl-CoA desaturase